MIGRVRDRGTFEAFRRRGRRARRGPITVVYLPAANGPLVRVAYGVGRATGSAVVRNKLRRRLRHIMRDMSRDDLLAQGAYLVLARPEAVESSFSELARAVAAACEEASR